MGKHTVDELRQWQALPLGIKIRMTQQRIRDWVNEYGVDFAWMQYVRRKKPEINADGFLDGTGRPVVYKKIQR